MIPFHARIFADVSIRPPLTTGEREKKKRLCDGGMIDTGTKKQPQDESDWMKFLHDEEGRANDDHFGCNTDLTTTKTARQ